MDALHPASKQRFGEYTWSSAPTPASMQHKVLFVPFLVSDRNRIPLRGTGEKPGKESKPPAYLLCRGFYLPILKCFNIV